MKKTGGHKASRTVTDQDVNLTIRSPRGPLSRGLYFIARDLSRAKWKKTSALHKGLYIATLTGFEKITGLKKSKNPNL